MLLRQSLQPGEQGSFSPRISRMTLIKAVHLWVCRPNATFVAASASEWFWDRSSAHPFDQSGTPGAPDGGRSQPLPSSGLLALLAGHIERVHFLQNGFDPPVAV